MAVEKTQVRVEAEGDQSAVQAAQRVERAMQRVEAQAKDTEAAVNEAEPAGIRSRFDRLLARARSSGILKRGGVEYGLLELNTGGIGLNRGYLRGVRFGGTAFVVSAIAHGVGRALEGGADLRDYVSQLIREELTTGQIVGKVVTEAVRKTARGLVDASGATSILTGILRIAGYRSDEISAALDLTFNPDGSEIDAEIEAGARRSRAIKAAHREHLQQLDRKLREALSEVDAQTEKHLRGLKNETLPVGLNREMAREYRRALEAGVRAQGERDKDRKRAEHKEAAGVGD